MASISSRAVEAVEKARATAHSWNRVAVFLQANPDIAERAYHGTVEPCVRVGVIREADPVATIVEYAGRAAAAGARIEADLRDTYSGVRARFGSAWVEFYARSEQVCATVPVAGRALVGPLAVLVREWPGHSVGVEPVTDEIREADPSVSRDARWAVVERTEGRFGKVCKTDLNALAGDLERTAQAFARVYGATYLPREGEAS